jgi:3-oxosteroid 1-dehydrogenase
VGGTTALSGGGAWFPANRHVAEVGITDSVEEGLEYLRACAGDAGDDAILVALAEQGAATVEYLEDRAGLEFRPWPSVGGTIDYRPWLPGAKHGGRTLDPGKFTVADLGDWGPRVRTGPASEWVADKLDYYAGRMHTMPLPKGAGSRARPHESGADAGAAIEHFASGTALIGRLLKAALEQGVTIVVEAPAEALVVEDGTVVGVRARRDGKAWNVRARRGVVVATGGFGQNEELKRRWLTRPLEYTCEPDTITGDGHLMGAAVGAQLADIDAWWMPKIRIGDEPQSSREDRILPHSLIVNMAGERFVNEATNYYDVSEAFGARQGGWPRNLPAWLLFDRQARDKYMMYGARVPEGPAPEGLIVADSIAELADRLGIDSDALQATIERFNTFAREGRDLDFHRGESGWDLAWGDPNQTPNPCLGELSEPPFYAVEVIAGALGTKGGLRIDARGQVLSAAAPFAPIAGLYAAGNCSSGAAPVSYPGAGSTIGAAMTFGYIIGRELARGGAASAQAAQTAVA